MWPAVPRYALCLAVTALVLVALWFVWLTNSNDELESERAKEVDAQGRLFEEGRAGRQPRPAEKAARAGAAVRDPAGEAVAEQGRNGCAALGHQPGGPWPQPAVRAVPPGLQVSVKDYYAELPIAVRVTGRYHDMGAFVADVAALSRIVTLNNITVTPQKDKDVLTMDTTARTFRYLDDDERAAQKRAAAPKGKK
jgi:type IV pilus assembly protein PilO